jgi:hypothetical protein
MADSPIYVCHIGDESPFDATIWMIPAQQQGKAGQRKSGKLLATWWLRPILLRLALDFIPLNRETKRLMVDPPSTIPNVMYFRLIMRGMRRGSCYLVMNLSGAWGLGALQTQLSLACGLPE